MRSSSAHSAARGHAEAFAFAAKPEAAQTGQEFISQEEKWVSQEAGSLGLRVSGVEDASLTILRQKMKKYHCCGGNHKELPQAD